jgi:peptide/nickel transport system permease protein
VQSVLRAPIAFSPQDRLRDQFDPARPHPWSPSRQHLLGTEAFGADILSRMIHASRVALAIGFISTGIALIIGVIVGGLMGYFSGIVDLLGMRLVEVFGAIPTIYLLLAFVAFFDRNLYLMMVIIGLTSWVGDARFVRAEFLKLRGQDFVQAAVASGLPLWRVLFRHLLPNAVAPLLVSASFGVASAILAETTLSFLGLGLVDEPSWGQLLNQAVTAGGGGFHWWLAVYPGLAIFLTVFSYNLIGEALRDALDPRLKKN